MHADTNLTDAQMQEVERRLDERESLKDISRALGVSTDTIRRAKRILGYSHRELSDAERTLDPTING